MSRSAFPASFAQQRLWFLDQLEPGTAAYNLVRVFRILGPLSAECMTRAFEQVMLRHASLRTVFDSFEGNPQQVVLPNAEINIPLVDLSDSPLDTREAEALRRAGEEGRRPFDLRQGPLIRAVLIRLGPESHVLVLVLHHILTDGWSISILFRELTGCYADLYNGRTSNLAPLSLQYADYAQWQRERMTGESLANEIRHWREKLAGAQTILDLPTDRPRPSTHSWHGSTQEIVLDSKVLTSMKSLAQCESATLFMVSLAAFQALLWRYSGQENVLVGSPVAGRFDVEVENMIGLFVNTLVFRADFVRGMSFRDLIRQVRSFALQAYSHQEMPFERLVEELVPQRSLNTHPLFQVMFTFQNIPKQVFEIPGLSITELAFDAGIAKFDLSAEVWDNGELHCQFEYNTDLYDRSTMERMLLHFEQLIISALKNPDQTLAQLDLMSAAERERVVVEWNRTEAEYPRNLAIPEAFEQQAQRTADSTALICEGQPTTYRQLNASANRFAHRLAQHGIGPGALVGISMPRSAEMVTAILGVLKAGAAYVPLDPAVPADRLRFMISDAGLSAIVTHSSVADRIPHDTSRVLVIDTDRGLAATSNPGIAIPAEQTAYVIYTSGSTGQPKGVEGTHRGALNRFAWMWKQYRFEAGEVCCQKTNLGFVDSIWEIFGPLLAGVPNVILPEETVRDPELLLQTLAREQVTRIVLVPSLLRALLEQAPNLGERVPKLRLWTCSGEVLPTTLARKFREAYPGAKLLNLYGSSEVAADVTCHEVEERDLESSVAIGRPISNTQIYLVDEYGNPVPAGVQGQIYVGGDGLARGYLNRPQLTAESFVANWIDRGRSPRLYRTGDIGRYRANGDVEYLGRVDHQVKLRGQRMELGEIETVLATHAGVQQAVVVVTGEADEQQLAAYVVAKEATSTPTATELRQHLRLKLPEHMVPASYWQIERVPLLASGKVNRGELARDGGRPLPDKEQLIAPRNEVEAKLAEIWRELLKVEQVGIEQNFFELGGHSLLVLQVAARIRRALEVEIPVRSVFEVPTIAGLAVEVEKARALGLKARMPIPQHKPRSTLTITDREVLLTQLEKLSPEEATNLLKAIIDGKHDLKSLA